MIKYTIKDNNVSMGRLCVPMDGDAAAQEERTVSHPEVYSVNTKNSPGGEFIGGHNSLSLSKTLLPADAIPTASTSSANAERDSE